MNKSTPSGWMAGVARGLVDECNRLAKRPGIIRGVSSSDPLTCADQPEVELAHHYVSIHLSLPETLTAPVLVQEADGTVHEFVPGEEPIGFMESITKDMIDEFRSSLEPRFNGPAYDPALDQVRLTGQALRVFRIMSDGKWWTLGEIAQTTGDPEASISAQLRHLRKPRFGGHTVNKRRRGEPGHGWWEYQLVARK